MELASLRADVDVIFEMREADHRKASIELAMETVFETLFKAPTKTRPDTTFLMARGNVLGALLRPLRVSS